MASHLALLWNQALQILALFQTNIGHFPHPFSDLAWAEIISSLLIMPTKTFLKIHVEIAYYSFSFYSFGIEITNTSIHFCTSPKTRPDSRPKWHKTLPLGAAHSYMAHMREDSPHPPGLKATWKWPIHKALFMKLAQTLYLQNHFSGRSILLPMKVFLSLILPFLKEK